MTNQLQTIIDPVTTEIPVTGDCGHVFPVPLARLEDGQEFLCPECGKADRFDEAGRQHAEEDLAKFQARAPANRLVSMIGAFLSRSKPAN